MTDIEEPCNFTSLFPIDVESESIFYAIMRNIAKVCKDNVYNMKEYPDEVDKYSKYGRGMVSIEHFSKILYAFGLRLKPLEFSEVVKKFIDFNYLFNFRLFCNCIEKLMKSDLSLESIELCYVRDKAQRNEIRTVPISEGIYITTEPDHPLIRPKINENLKTIIYRIQDYIFKYSIRDFRQYFKDKDPYNSKMLSPEAFKNVLSSLGIATGTYGNLTLNEDEINNLISFYSDNSKNVIWPQFYSDINSVWALPIGEMERSPDLVYLNRNGKERKFYSINDRGTLYKDLSLLDRLKFEKLIRKIAADKIEEIDLKSLLKQFDKINNGRTLSKQFRNCMDSFGRKYSNSEMVLLEAKYYDSKGFNYRQFLNDIERILEKFDPMRRTWIKFCQENLPKEEINEVCSKNISEISDDYLPSIFDVMTKVRFFLQKTNCHLWQFLTQFRKTPINFFISKEELNSALQCAYVELTEKELEVLFRNYRISTNNLIDYEKFYNDLERLDKIQVVHPPSCFPPDHVDFSFFKERMNERELKDLERAIAIFAHYGYDNLVQHADNFKFTYLEYTGFLKVLDRALNSKNILTDEQNRLLFKAFSKPIGLGYGLNIKAFVKHIERIKRALNEQIGNPFAFLCDPNYQNIPLPATSY